MTPETLKEWILEEMNGEVIEAVVIGEMGWGDYHSENVPNYDTQPKGKVLTWEEALPYIDYPFDSGYGAPGCNAVVAWSKSYIFTVVQYDGSTSPVCIPRNPTDFMPKMPGG